MKKIFKLLIVVFILLVIIGPGSALAAKGVGLSPAVTEINLAEDQESVSFELTVSNTTEAETELRLSTLDFGALDESGGVAFLGQTGQEAAARGLKQWMDISQDTLVLEAGESAVVTVTINNNDSLSPGGHYGAVVVSSVDSQAGVGESVSVLPAASTLVLLKKSGGDVQELKLDNAKANGSMIDLPKSASLRFENAGNTHLVPRGTVELISPTGSVVSRGVINESSSYILPETFRGYESGLQTYGQPWLPGRYKLVVSYRYDGTEQMVVFEKSYWYLGKLAIYTILVISTVIVLVLYIRYRRRPVSRGQ